MNSLGSLLVHLDDSPRSEARLALAQLVAAKCDTGAAATCVIEALYCVTPITAEMPLAFGEGVLDVGIFMKDLHDLRRDKARQLFERVNGSSARRMGWREVADGSIFSATVGRALYADLVFLGQHEADELNRLTTPADFVASVLIDSGKPAIVVPNAGDFGTLGDEVLIAWKPCREAARAVSAALPLLQRATHVHVASEAGNYAAAKDLDGWLRANGVEARLEHHAALGSNAPGEGLLSLAAEINADLLVMGCYGHSRVREWALGGATRTVLASMTLPVLMAH